MSKPFREPFEVHVIVTAIRRDGTIELNVESERTIGLFKPLLGAGIDLRVTPRFPFVGDEAEVERFMKENA